MQWFWKIKEQRAQLEDNLKTINNLINKHNHEATDFKGNFKTNEISKPFKYLGTFQDYEMDKLKKGEKTSVPMLTHMSWDYQSIIDENKRL